MAEETVVIFISHIIVVDVVLAVEEATLAVKVVVVVLIMLLRLLPLLPLLLQMNPLIAMMMMQYDGI